jgi:acyl dehydratase
VSESGLRGVDWGEVETGVVLPDVTLRVTYDMVAGHVAGTRDWFPGHHDPHYARDQGQENIYGNTMFFQGFTERVVQQWAGPAWFVSDRTLRIAGSVYPGDTMTGSAQVAAKAQAGGLFTVDLRVEVRTRTPRPVLTATVQLAMTSESRAWWSRHVREVLQSGAEPRDPQGVAR